MVFDRGRIQPRGKIHLKTLINNKTTFSGRMWAIPILITTRTTIGNLARWFSTPVEKLTSRLNPLKSESMLKQCGMGQDRL